MDSLEAIQLPTSRTFWNSHDPSLDPFDETLVPAMASDPLEECSSTFQQLFPSTGSACDESDDHQAMFKVNSPSHQQTNIFGVHSPNGDGGAEDQSSLATAQSYSCTNAHDHGGSMHHPSASSSQFTWSLPSPPPHYQAGVSMHVSLTQTHLHARAYTIGTTTADDLSCFSRPAESLLYTICTVYPQRGQHASNSDRKHGCEKPKSMRVKVLVTQLVTKLCALCSWSLNVLYMLPRVLSVCLVLLSGETATAGGYLHHIPCQSWLD
jgi:hypothetical protein